MIGDCRPVAVDLFSGVGGMSLGFEQAGFDVAAAVEIGSRGGPQAQFPRHGRRPAFGDRPCRPGNPKPLRSGTAPRRCRFRRRAVPGFLAGSARSTIRATLS